MEEKISGKIGSIIDYIINKPTEEITLDDYTILSTEAKDIRFRKKQAESDERFKQLMAAYTPGVFNGC